MAGEACSAAPKPLALRSDVVDHAVFFKIARRWEGGFCRFGDRCNFAHGDDELRNLPARQPAPRGRGRGYGDEDGYRDDDGRSPPGRGGGRGGVS